jgi:hypothetical protein
VLPEPDQNYLSERWPGHSITTEDNQVVVVLPGFCLPEGFEPRTVEMLLMLPFGFPETPPDMFWVSPRVTLRGAPPQTAELTQQIIGRAWQRFSRHLPAGAWRPGDNLKSWVTMINTMLQREATTGRLVA